MYFCNYTKVFFFRLYSKNIAPDLFPSVLTLASVTIKVNGAPYF